MKKSFFSKILLLLTMFLTAGQALAVPGGQMQFVLQLIDMSSIGLVGSSFE